jgi:hypothetical protein
MLGREDATFLISSRTGKAPAMSNDPQQDQQRRNVAEFMQLLPLTIAIAGLPDAEHGKHFNEGQMDTRATTIRNAYKVARQLIKEVAARA